MVYQVSSRSELTSKLAEAGDKLVVVDFYATWCGPCKMIAPQLEALQKETPNLVLLKVDVDESEEIATEFGISAMPTFVFFKNSLVVDKFTGANFEKLKALVTKQLA